ncbi:unnamed protein product [Closterium sp. NIES-54]
MRPSTTPQRVSLPSPPASSLPDGPDPESDSLRAASPTVTRFLATAVTDPLFESSAASALVAELVDFAAACRLDNAASLVAESASASVCPPSVGGECALGTDVLEDRQEDLECFAAASPHLVSMLLAPEGDPEALDIPTPCSYAQAIEGPYSSQWQAAMDAEMAFWKSTGTYVDEVPPPGANIVSGMWIFRVKRPPGSPPAFKARYVARGFSQRQGVDFFQTFSPTPKMTTLRVLLHVAAQRDYELHSLDFSTAFLQGSFDEALMDFGFERSECDPALHHLVRDEGRLSLYLYVDDILLMSSSMVLLDEVKGLLSSRFRMKDLGEAKYYLGVQIERDESGILIHQERYILNMLDSFGLSKANPMRTPLPTGFDVHAHAEEPLLKDELVQLYQSIVGSLMYASTTTQPQIAYAVSQLSKVVSCPKAFHLQAAKRVLRYLKGCVKSGIFYPAHSKPQVELVGFSDADYVGDSADRKSHTGYVYCLNGAAISCQCQCIQEGVWLKRLFGEFGHDLAGGVPVFVDNQSAIALAQNACLHGRTKHMQVRWHFIREMVASGKVILQWCPTNRQAADILTKPLPFERHGVCMSLMGMQPHVGMVPEQDVGGLVLLCLDDIMMWTAPLPGQGGVE